jgi:RHS repeat-associated protein
LTAAQYAQTFSYDTMGRLAIGPLGTYTYGDSAHTHAATSIGSTFTAAYDAAGDMTCRAPSSGLTCSGTQTGAQLIYNNEGELSTWQNQPSSPTSTAAFLYDGQGNRVVQQSTSSGATTTTVYVGSMEEDSTTGTSTTKTTYYYANGVRIATAANGVFSFLASDGLGSANATLNNSGSVTASVLYAPYGSSRYASGAMPTSFGFTGQRADTITGLDYYNARYYDAVSSQFTSADTLLPGGGFDVWGLSRYAYVEGNPIIRTDPSGKVVVADNGGGGCYPCSTPAAVTRIQSSSCAWYDVACGVGRASQAVAKGLDAIGTAISQYAEYRANQLITTAREVLAKARAQQDAVEATIGTGFVKAYNLIRGKARAIRQQSAQIGSQAMKDAKGLEESGGLLKAGSKVAGRTLVVVGGVSDGMDDYSGDTRYADPAQRTERAIVAGSSSAVGALVGDALGLSVCEVFAVICSPIFAYAGGEVLKDLAVNGLNDHLPPVGPLGTELVGERTGMA